MRMGILGRKVGMTQVYDAEGNLHAVTVIEAGPCTVLAVRTKERDGYEAVQLGFVDKKRKQASRAERGQVANIKGHRQKRRVSARPARRRQGQLRAQALHPRVSH